VHSRLLNLIVNTEKYMKKRALLISFKIGMGHVQAARAIYEELADQNVEVKHIDLSDYCTVASKKFYQQGYLRMVTHAPALYSLLYRRIPSSSARSRAFFDSINAAKLRKFIRDYQPDIIVSTHFIVTSLLSRWKDKAGLDFKLIFTGTDFAAHRLWFDKKVDLYFSPSESVRTELLELGVKGEIIVSGIPIGRNFSKEFDKTIIRKDLDLEDRFTILLINGGFGVGKSKEILQSLVGQNRPIQIIAVAGLNNKLKLSLEQIASRSTSTTVKVFGFSDKISELMAVSDLIISKAGGLTVAESLAIGTPLLAFEPTPGQEEANIKFLELNNAALSAHSILDIEANVRYILDGVINLSKLRENVRKVARPDSSKIIGQKLIELLRQD